MTDRCFYLRDCPVCVARASRTTDLCFSLHLRSTTVVLVARPAGVPADVRTLRAPSTPKHAVVDVVVGRADDTGTGEPLGYTDGRVPPTTDTSFAPTPFRWDGTRTLRVRPVGHSPTSSSRNCQKKAVEYSNGRGGRRGGST